MKKRGQGRFGDRLHYDEQHKMGVTEGIVRFVGATRFDAVPDEVVFRTKTLIADAIGTMLVESRAWQKSLRLW